MKKYKNIVQQINDIDPEKTEKELTIFEESAFETWKEMEYSSQETLKELTELNTTADNILDCLKLIKVYLGFLIVIVIAVVVCILIK